MWFKQFLKELLCLHDWKSQGKHYHRWAQGLYYNSPVLVETYENYYCTKCGKFKCKSLGEHIEAPK